MPPARWSMPYGVANAIGFSLEHGYRFLRRTTGLKTQPLLSRQAVAVLGIDQDFSNRKARELLGWAPRIDYAPGSTGRWPGSLRSISPPGAPDIGATVSTGRLALEWVDLPQGRTQDVPAAARTRCFTPRVLRPIRRPMSRYRETTEFEDAGWIPERVEELTARILLASGAELTVRGSAEEVLERVAAQDGADRSWIELPIARGGAVTLRCDAILGVVEA